MSKPQQEVPQPEQEEPMADQVVEESTDARSKTATEEEAAEEDVASLNWEVMYTEMEDRLKRLAAEFTNYKNRVGRERLELMDTAGKKTMLALLPVLDDFDRARQAAQNDEEKRLAFESGVGLIIKKLFDSLASQGLKAMDSNGADFDADRHEAITEIPHPELAGKIVDTVESGYTLNGNIIRYAKVVVGK